VIQAKPVPESLHLRKYHSASTVQARELLDIPPLGDNQTCQNPGRDDQLIEAIASICLSCSLGTMMQNGSERESSQEPDVKFRKIGWSAYTASRVRIQ